MNEDTALVEIQRLDVAVIFTEVGMTSLLFEIEKKAKDFTPDLTTDASRKEIASMAYKVARSKTLIDDVGKKSMEEWKAKVNNCNKYRKQARVYLDNLKDEIRKPLTEWEAEQEQIKAEVVQKEKERVEGIQTKIQIILNMCNLSPWTSSEKIKEAQWHIKKISEEGMSDFQEFGEQANQVIAETLKILDDLLAKRLQFEKEETDRKAEIERLEKIRLDQEAEAARIKEAQDIINAANKRIANEKAQIEAEKKAEQDRKEKDEAIAKAKAEAKAEAEKVAKEKVEREEREKKEREEAEVKEKAHKEAMKSDREKLITYGQALQNIPKPEVKSPQAQDILNDASRDIRALMNRITKRAEEL